MGSSTPRSWASSWPSSSWTGPRTAWTSRVSVSTGSPSAASPTRSTSSDRAGLTPRSAREARLHDGSQRRQRERPLGQHRVVERADVEPTGEPAASLLAEPMDLELAELVGDRLAGPADVAIALVGDVARGERRVLEHVGDRPIA